MGLVIEYPDHAIDLQPMMSVGDVMVYGGWRPDDLTILVSFLDRAFDGVSLEIPLMEALSQFERGRNFDDAGLAARNLRRLAEHISRLADVLAPAAI